MNDLRNPDRVLATVLFTDIVGSTELAAEMGDQRWRELLDTHHARVRTELEQFNGREVKTMGDGFLATFDSPARAVLCARAIAESMTAIGVRIRAGIHTGETEIMGEDVGGIAVHIAARVAGRADPDEILVSSTVKDLVEGSHIAFTPKGSRALALKGIPGRWRLYAVRWQPERAASAGLPRRSEHPLVGRAAEMAVGRAQVDAAAAGSLRVLCVEGEPGIGKTRLLDETAAYASERGFTVAFVGADEEVAGPFFL
ncbi:MAG TPA: adenylate/guanylate cyclase domain-containing protein, partial [Actinomycetota bacterium]|nr:adenylate/guanylate cyclase domain-containing protein [Actinomycetota bacterium]